MIRTSALILLGSLAAIVGACDDTPSSETIATSQQALDDERCTWGLGYWKNHPDAWKADTLALGSVAYSQDQLLDILHEPVDGNGLVSLAHQLIASKLNLLEGADDVTGGAVTYADTLIGDLVVPPIGSGSLATADTSGTSTVLDEFNKGRLDGSCHTAFCGDGILDPQEQCDDGNVDNTDACLVGCVNATCGDGYVYAGIEGCDDGNSIPDDFCSPTCVPDNGDGMD